MSITTFSQYRKIRKIKSKSALHNARVRFAKYQRYKQSQGFRKVGDSWAITQM